MTDPEDLLLRFREAAEIEHRLLELESWLIKRMPETADAQVRHWRIASIRALKLIIRDRRLKPFNPDILAYLRLVFEARVGGSP